MKLSFRLLIITAVILSSGCRNRQTQLKIYDLRCENLSEPAGIATATPGLSWKIRSETNGASQQAFQLLVASSRDLLNEAEADLWNSGRIISSAEVLVPFGGKPLNSGYPCYWKVRIWDRYGHAPTGAILHFSASAYSINQTGMHLLSDFRANRILM